jgi:dolichyl-phosphate-mannose-protein mannosyltransferase
MPEKTGARRDLVIALLLALVAAVFRLPRLGFPPEEIFDEVYHAKTALQYLRGEPIIEWVHPPTAKLLIAVGVYFFGYLPWAWRLMPALAGIALAPVFYLLARRALPSERAAVLAAALLLCDGVYLVQSRTAMTNIFAVLFQVAAALFIVGAISSERLHTGRMLAAGLALGLALSTRWTSLWAAGFLGAVLAVARGQRLLRPRELGLTFAAFAVLPACLYTASYVPWMEQRHHPRSFADVRLSLGDMVEEQSRVWEYHANLRAQHPYFSSWYTWPWLYRPTWYYFNQPPDSNVVRGIVAIGNPGIWWVSVPVSLWAVLVGARRRDVWLLFSGLGFFALFLPWGISPRKLNYSHYLFEAIPYACLSLGNLLDRTWDEPGAWAPRAYLILVVLLFLYFYPFLAALPIPRDWYYYRLHGVGPWTWFRTWV